MKRKSKSPDRTEREGQREGGGHQNLKLKIEAVEPMASATSTPVLPPGAVPLPDGKVCCEDSPLCVESQGESSMKLDPFCKQPEGEKGGKTETGFTKEEKVQNQEAKDEAKDHAEKKRPFQVEEEKKEAAFFEFKIAQFDPEFQKFFRENYDCLAKRYPHPSDGRIHLYESIHCYEIDGCESIVALDGVTPLLIEEVYSESGKQIKPKGPRSWMSVSSFSKLFLPSQGSVPYLKFPCFISNRKRKQDPEYKYFGLKPSEITAMWKENSEARDRGTSMHHEIEMFLNFFAQDKATALKFLDGPLRCDLKIPSSGKKELGQFREWWASFAKEHVTLRTELRLFSKKYKLCGTVDAVFFKRKVKVKDPLTEEQREYDITDFVSIPAVVSSSSSSSSSASFSSASSSPPSCTLADLLPKTEEERKKLKALRPTLMIMMGDWKRSKKITGEADGKKWFEDKKIPHGPGTKHYNPFWTGIGPCAHLAVCNKQEYNLSVNMYSWLFEETWEVQLLKEWYNVKVVQRELLEFHPEHASWKMINVPDYRELINKLLAIRLQCLEENKYVHQPIPEIYDAFFPETRLWSDPPPEMALYNVQNSEEIRVRLEKQEADIEMLLEVERQDLEEEALLREAERQAEREASGEATASATSTGLVTGTEEQGWQPAPEPETAFDMSSELGKAYKALHPHK